MSLGVVIKKRGSPRKVMDMRCTEVKSWGLPSHRSWSQQIKEVAVGLLTDPHWQSWLLHTSGKELKWLLPCPILSLWVLPLHATRLLLQNPQPVQAHPLNPRFYFQVRVFGGEALDIVEIHRLIFSLWRFCTAASIPQWLQQEYCELSWDSALTGGFIRCAIEVCCTIVRGMLSPSRG